MNHPLDVLPAGAVTFLFSDIEGSTRLWESAPEDMRRAVETHDRIISDAVAASGGAVFKTGGDSFCVAFSEPAAALEAAITAQRRLLASEWDTPRPLRVRMGLHTGTAQRRGNDYFGPALNRTARLMEAGHGGQILLSAATHHLVVDELPPDVALRELGVHHLRDLDRPEQIFQVAAEGLPADLPPLRSTPGSGAGLAEGAETAFHAKRWQESLDTLLRLESTEPLTGEQHEMAAQALWWLGRQDELRDRLERAHQACVAAGDTAGAARVAIQLAEAYHHALAPDVSRAWQRKAERLLEGDTDSPVRGHLLRWKVVHALEVDGDLDGALALAGQVMEVALATGDADLEVLSLQDQGRILVAMGRVDEGMALMDQAMLSAVAGDVTPIVVGRSYCNMLSVCDKTGNIRRASEWSDAAQRWCEEAESAPYPGVCRIFKAEVMWQKGDWAGAQEAVQQAVGELEGFSDLKGEAWYHYGEMRRRIGDLEGAEEAFREALARGRQPIPGYAVMLAQRGEASTALELLGQALAGRGVGKLDRTGILAAVVDVALGSGDLERAGAAASELAEIATLANSDQFRAMAERGAGRVALAGGDPSAAIRHLTEALETFTRIGLPYEAALTRADLAAAHRSAGSESIGAMELSAAIVGLKRLGALPDVERLAGRSD